MSLQPAMPGAHARLWCVSELHLGSAAQAWAGSASKAQHEILGLWS